MASPPPPPPPPPHGEAPKTTAGGSGLPPGKYDVFIIPEHSAGSGFLYLPSLRTNTNSFIAGFATAIIVVVFAQSMAPAFQAWWANFQGMGNAGMTLLMIAVGLGAWSLGRQTSDATGTAHGTSEGNYYSGGGGSMPGGGPGFGNAGAGSHGVRPEHAANAGAGPSSGAHAAPGGGSGASQPNGHKPSGAYQRPSQPQPQAQQAPPQPQPQPQAYAPPPPPPPPQPQQAPPQPPPPPPPQAQAPPPPPEPPRPQPTPRTSAPPPQPSAAAKAQAEAHKNAWEKAREEVRRKEEERKAREAEEKRKADVAARLKELREKEARERAQREAERARREAEAKEAKEKEAREARAKEIRERLVREREERRKKLEEERKRDEEKKLEEEKKRKEAESAQSRVSGSYAFSGVGEKTNPWPNGKPPTVPPQAANPPPRSPSPNKKPSTPTARSFASTTDDDAHSYRPYDQARQPGGRRASNSDLSESSWAPSQSTARTTPPPSVRGPYTTKDPDKIVIKAVYCFMNQFSKTPASQLISGVGSVTDGLILRITTEGLFIDDDLRGVAQREWDVKAWTLKLVEVWCPVHFLACAIAANSTPITAKNATQEKISTAFFAKQTGGSVRLRAAERANPKALSGDDADTYLGEMLATCNSSCRLGDCASSFAPSTVDGNTGDDASNVTSTCSGSSTRTNNSATQTGDWKAKGLHLLRATVRDQEGKRYMFVVGEEEGWKVAMGLQKLRKGSQVRALGVAGIGGLETKNTLEMLGWG